MTTAERIAYWSDMLRDISANGLTYAENVYDKDRYQQLQNLAIEMLAQASGTEISELERLREPVLSRPTPITAADAAVIDSTGRLLMIQRADNKTWAMPGGYLEVGETAAEGAAREALEETGVTCKPLQMVGIYDSRICGSITAHHLYLITVLCEPIEPSVKPSHAHEVLDVGWFAEEEIPENLCPGHAVRSADAFRMWRGDGRAYLDV